MENEMKFLHSLFREFQSQELGQSKMCETKIKSWSKHLLSSFFLWRKTENWWKCGGRSSCRDLIKTTPDLPKSLIPNSKNQVFIQHDHFQVFLNFFFQAREQASYKHCWKPQSKYHLTSNADILRASCCHMLIPPGLP